MKNLLSDSDIVYTHNPWGEYGNSEHVQVNYAVRKLSIEIGFEVWVTGYVSNKTFLMMEKNSFLLNKNPIILRSNIKLFNEIKDFYTKYGCWTFYDKFFPSSFDIFYKLDYKNYSKNILEKPLLLNFIFSQENNLLKRFCKFLCYKFIFYFRFIKNLLIKIFSLYKFN